MKKQFYTSKDVKSAPDAVMRGQYVCDGRAFIVDAYNTVYETVNGENRFLTKLKGRTPKTAIANMLSQELMIEA